MLKLTVFDAKRPADRARKVGDGGRVLADASMAGRQFDPLVVSALETCLAAEPDRVPAGALV